MQIVIHTYGRSNAQKTFHNLPNDIKKITKLVVQKREKDLYRGYNTIILPDKIRDLSATRQWLIDNAYEEHLCMMDDDITNFSIKTKSGKLVKATDKQIIEMFKNLDAALLSHAHAGVPYRQFNREDPKIKFSYNTRMMSLLCYDVSVVRKMKCRFDRVLLKQDFDMTLQLLRKGCANVMLLKYGINVSSPQKASGGVTEYRTEEANTEAAYRLQKLHPEFVKVVEKKTKSSYGGGVRTEVLVSWKKAYESSRRK